MPSVPTPRSYNQILADLIDAFQSRFAIPSMRVGSPILSILEATAQSDLRASQDIFTMLNSIALDRAEGDALDRIGADEDLPRRTETFASGLVNIGDDSFAKISSKVYVGQPAPIIGSGTIYVADATSFTSTGSVYIGRGTLNFEGPLAYTAKTNLGTYWSLTLTGGSETQKFHNLNESIVLAQGGNRLVPAGTLTQTTQGNVSEAVKFSTLYAGTVPDGEVSVTGVQVVAQRPGLDGNVPAGSINGFSSSPFTGATVTNPLPFSNAIAGEDDRSYRERIRKARQSRAKGTPLAIESGVLGVVALDENKSVLSASIVTRQGFPTTLYIDDGTGYEEKTQGVAIESIIASATGGERYFEVNQRPVAKAFVETTIEEPYNLSSGSKLAVKVNGITYKHTFSEEEFRNIANATAYEAVASINGDDDLPFDARLSSNGSRFSIIADEDTQEDLEVVEVDEGETDANSALGFTAGRVDTMLLYKNDRLLNKDGRLAILGSLAQSLWAASLTSTSTLILDVDGTGSRTYSFTAQDFVDQQTGYTTLASSNSLDSWVIVFNSRLTGVTATKSGSSIILISNLGPDSRASVEITGGTMVADNMFLVEESLGLGLDYTLDRNTGQFRLETALATLDTLSAGTAATRAFIESATVSTTTLAATADQWWVVDGQATVVATSIIAGNIVTIDDYVLTPAASWGDRVRTTASSGTPFIDVVVGDWAIFYDSVFSANNQGAWRVAYVDPTGTYFDIERPTAGWTTQTSIVLTTGGLVFVHTEARLQKVSIAAAADFTAASFVDELNEDLRGATAEIYRTNKIRVRTNTFTIGGDIALVAQNTEAEKLMMTVGDYIPNLTSHLAVAEAEELEYGTPEFILGEVDTVTSTVVFDRTATDPGLTSGHQLVFERPLNDEDTGSNKSRYANANFHSALSLINGTTLTLRTPVLQEFLPTERFYAAAPYAIGPEDEFTALVDEDEQSQRCVLPMWRQVKATTSTYGTTNLFTDSDNSDLSLARAFGLSYDFLDFAAWMKARTKTHNEAGDTTKTVLFRYIRFGPEGNQGRLRYTYPDAANSSIAVDTDVTTDGYTQIGISLPSGAARTGQTIRNSTRIGLMAATGPNNNQTLTYILGYSITSAVRIVKLDYTGQTGGTGDFSLGETVTGFSSGAFGTVGAGSNIVGPAGTLILTGVTGIFSSGEVITGSVTATTATTVNSQYGVTTLTLDIATPGAGVHGFSTGNILFVASTDLNFPSGLKTLTATAAGTVTYTDTTAVAQGATPNIGTISYDAGEASLGPSNVAVSDLVNVNTLSSLTAAYERTSRITSFADQYFKAVADTGITPGTTPTWLPLVQASYLQFFPINTAGSTAAAIATAVNALAAVDDSTCPVTAVAIGLAGDTTGIVSKASYDEFDTVTPKYYQLTDGINWVRTQIEPVLVTNNYSLTFKDTVTASLATNSDWANEEVRLVPVTTKNVVDWFNTQGVSGLSSAAENARSESGDKPQIATLLPGSVGGVRVQGGQANSVSAPVVGSATSVATTYGLATIKKSDAIGLRGGQWVNLVNTNTSPKQVFAAGSIILSIGANGVIVVDAGSSTNAWDYANAAAAAVNGFTWQIEKQGRYTAFVWEGIGAAPVLTGVEEGDWVTISAGTINSRNEGRFRIIRASETQHVFWIENASALEETETADLVFRTYDSIMPGDSLIINTDIFGADNIGTWIVDTIDPTNRKLFTLVITDRVPAAFSGPVTLGTSSPLVQVFESEATTLVKKIRSISPNPDNGLYADVKFETDLGYRQVSVVAGTLIQPLDKFHFPVDLFLGVDGYRFSTGLVKEVNRVAYGDPGDPAAYPGIIAAGAQVNIQGPLIKRVTCSLSLRLKSGVSSVDIINRVRSAVASVINGVGVGEPIAISDLVTAAGSINGVVAVTVLEPTFTIGNDLISVQPFEKPLILDLEQDIAVSLVSD